MSVGLADRLIPPQQHLQHQQLAVSEQKFKQQDSGRHNSKQAAPERHHAASQERN